MPRDYIIPGSDPVVGKIEHLGASQSLKSRYELRDCATAKSKAEIERAAAQRCYDIAMGYKAQTVAEMIRQEFNL